MFKLISVSQLISQTIKIYHRNLKIIFKILSLLIAPILVLRLLFHYANLQFLEIFYALLFGALAALLGIVVKIMIIYLIPPARASSDDQVASAARLRTLQFKNLFKQSIRKSLSYIWIVVITTFITLSVPLFGNALLGFDLANYYNYLIYFIIILWSFIFSLLFVFVIYGLVLANKKGLSAIFYSKDLVLKSPLEIALKIIILLLFFGAWLILLSAIINSAIAVLIGQFDQLTRDLPWWANITVDLCAILGLPFLIIGGGLLFQSAEGG